MEFHMLNKGLDFAKRRKKWVILVGLLGASTYGAYKVYNLPSLTRKRRRLFRLVKMLVSVAEMVSDSAETVGFVCNDLKEFLKSDSDEISSSLRQISKIAKSDEFSETVTRVSEGLTVGVLRAYRSESSGKGVEGGVSFADRVLDRIVSDSGSGFASVVAGSFARNLVLGYYSSGVGSSDGSGIGSVVNDGKGISNMSKWVDLVCCGKSKEMVENCIQVFVSSAVAVYLEKTLDINVYDELFAGLTNPNHESKMKDLLVSVCNGAVETLVKTSHDVLTSKKTAADPSSSSFGDSHVGIANSNGGEFGNGTETPTHLTSNQLSDQAGGSSWSSAVFSTLSVPQNREFVLGVTGRVTYETCRSFVDVLSWKLSDGLKSSSNVVQYKGRQIVRFFGLKSYVAVVICLVLCLYIIYGTKALLPS